jgi:gliding motility-associated-like protein
MNILKKYFGVMLLLSVFTGIQAQDITEVSTISTPVTCGGGSDGTITIEVDGGVGDLNYYLYQSGAFLEFSGSIPDRTFTFSGYSKGVDYEIYVTDANSGTQNLVVNTSIGGPDPILVSVTSTSNVTCNGGTDGSATITVSGGTPGHNFLWEGQLTGATSADQNPAGLTADIYDLTVTDAAGCIKVFTSLVTITEPDPITVTIAGVTNVSCFGGSNGSADITVAGGTSPYGFSWTGTTGYTSAQEDPTGMPAGTYSLVITDNSGCIQNFPDLFTITEPGDITALLDGSTDVSCFGGNDGTAQVTIENGTAPYSVRWIGDLTGHISTTEDPGNLVADTYDLEVTDDNGCVKVFDNIVIINQPDDITATFTITDVDCNGASTGEIAVLPQGGTTPYSFSWTGPNGYTSTSQDISGLEAGAYDLTITDAQGCIREFNNNVVDENSAITATFIVTNLTCNGAGDGEVDVTVNGGTPPYTYSWSGDNGYTNTTNADITGLDAANYTLTVMDALGCIQSFPAQAVTEPAPLAATFSATNVNCFGYNDGTINVTVSGGTPTYDYQWTGPNGFIATTEDISGLEPGSYSLKVTDANVCEATYTDAVTITEPTEITVVPTSTDISCNGAGDGTITTVTSGGTPGYTYAWTGPNGFSSDQPNLSSLEAGVYSLTVTDANSCIRVLNNFVTIDEPPAIAVNFTGQTNLDCFGDSDGTITIDVTGGVAPYSFSWSNSAGTVVSVVEDPSGLPAGTYSLVVTDNSLCTASYPDAVELTQPTQLTATLEKTDVLCAGENNGTITVTAAGGTAPYTYSLFSGGPYTSSNTFTGLSKGTYNVYTRDANGCTTNGKATINQPETISYQYSVSGQNLCYDDSSVTVTINNVTGGVAPFEYSIDGGTTYQTDSVFNNIPGGTYPVVVRDANLCEKAILPLTVFQPDSITITYYDQDDISSCSYAPEGRIAIQANGGTGEITYALNGGTPGNENEFTGLTGGNYVISMIDEYLCQKDTTVVILAPDPIVFDDATVIDVTGCPGDSNGQIEVSASGGTGQIRYSIDGSPLNPSGLFNGLTAGDYLVTAEDDNGCSNDTTLTVAEPLPVNIPSATAVPATCNGTSTGEITVVAEGGTPPYTFTLTPALLPPQNTGTFSGLPAGDYTVEVNDSESCGPVATGTITITEPPVIQVDSVKVEQISCNGSGDGKISVFISGGTAPYEYSIDNEVSYQSTSGFTGLAPGTYDVFVRDANGCSLYIDSYILNEPPVLTITGVVTDVAPCFGDANGTFTASASGGWNDYVYSIDGLNFQSTGEFTGLAAGDYTVTVQDTGSCSVTADFTIAQPEAVSATIVKTDYVGTTLGTITISDTAGGTPPYDYSIDGPAGTFSSTTSYTDLVAGSYEVIVRDANGCMYQDTIIILDIQPLNMAVSTTDVSCYGLVDASIEFQPLDAEGIVNYSIDGGTTYVTTPLFENLPGDSTYLMSAYDEAGKEYSGTVTINEPELLSVFASVSPANCNAFSETGGVDLTISGGTGVKTVLWSDGNTGEDQTNVVAGEHIYTVTDENGCEVTDTANIPAFVIVNAEAGKDTTVCAGSTLVLDAVPGDVMLWEPATYLSNTGVPDPVVSNISDTMVYTYTSRETGSGYGCYDIDTVRINVLPTYGLEITQDTFALEGQSIQLGTSTDGNFVSYQWIPETGLDQANVPDPVATLLTSTRYVLLATNDYGCIESDSVLIELVEDLTVYNAFSPNDDFTNDYFEIDNASKFPDIVVQVFNRWGSRIFYSEGYSDEKRWDGTFNGKDAPVGTYYYVIIPKPGATPITGNVTIIR